MTSDKQKNGCIELELQNPAVPDIRSEETLRDLDRVMDNYKKGEASPAIDLSDFE